MSVGIKEIDQQHQRLVKMINDLDAAMRLGKGKEVLSQSLQGMISYVQTHFRTEESYFAKFSYPKAVEHIAEHQMLTAKVIEFKKEFESGQKMLTIPLINFLSDWLKQHIMGTDMQYGPFLREKGLA